MLVVLRKTGDHDDGDDVNDDSEDGVCILPAGGADGDSGDHDDGDDVNDDGVCVLPVGGAEC